MAAIWIYTLASVIIVSLISLLGVLTISWKEGFLRRILLLLVSFSAGALLGDVFIHLLPELVEEVEFSLTLSLYVLWGIIIFFILEKFILWRHCHIEDSSEHHHPFAYTNLVGDALHNFIDGMIIAGSYMISIPLGIATTIAVAFHEIPQELGDFGVLIHAGFKKRKALFYNYVVALTAIIGALLTLAIGVYLEAFSIFVAAMTIGGFIYIASSDLIPELHKEREVSQSISQLIFFVGGIAMMAALLLLE